MSRTLRVYRNTKNILYRIPISNSGHKDAPLRERVDITVSSYHILIVAGIRLNLVTLPTCPNR